jgi:predicted secreted protein
MDTLFAIALYIFIWWLTLFVVLPFGVRTQHEEGIVVLGTPESAPAKARILRAFLINTVLASVVFGIVYVVIEYKLIDPDKFQLPW